MIDNWVYRYVSCKFSWEGFARIDVLETLKDAGLSASHAKRLFREGAIKVWDTRVTGERVEWFKRSAKAQELIEPNDAILCGVNKAVIMKPVPFSLFEKVFYKSRLLVERLMDKFVK